jgi:hypothetical protein
MSPVSIATQARRRSSETPAGGEPYD